MVNGLSAVAGGSQTSRIARTVGEISPEQFLKLLITQLQNQDPFEPVKNQELMEQISTVRELQSTLDLSRTLTATALQQEIAAAGALIGKHITGLNGYLDRVGGIVTSVTVEGGKVYLDLDTGQRVAMKDVTRVSVAPAGAPNPAPAT